MCRGLYLKNKKSGSASNPNDVDVEARKPIPKVDTAKVNRPAPIKTVASTQAENADLERGVHIYVFKRRKYIASLINFNMSLY